MLARVESEKDLASVVGHYGVLLRLRNGAWIAIRYRDSHASPGWSSAVVRDSGGAWFVSDSSINVGDYTFISWNVVLMDTYRASRDFRILRNDLSQLPGRTRRCPEFDDESRPISIGSNVWIGFDVCVLSGVRIGNGAIIGARSVVMTDIPPYSIAAGNPARVIREVARPPA